MGRSVGVWVGGEVGRRVDGWLGEWVNQFLWRASGRRAGQRGAPTGALPSLSLVRARDPARASKEGSKQANAAIFFFMWSSRQKRRTKKQTRVVYCGLKKCISRVCFRCFRRSLVFGSFPKCSLFVLWLVCARALLIGTSGSLCVVGWRWE